MSHSLLAGCQCWWQPHYWTHCQNWRKLSLPLSYWVALLTLPEDFGLSQRAKEGGFWCQKCINLNLELPLDLSVGLGLLFRRFYSWPCHEIYSDTLRHIQLTLSSGLIFNWILQPSPTPRGPDPGLAKLSQGPKNWVGFLIALASLAFRLSLIKSDFQFNNIS